MNHVRTLERIRDAYARKVERLSRALNRSVADTSPDVVVKVLADLQEARARHRALDAALKTYAAQTAAHHNTKPRGM